MKEKLEHGYYIVQMAYDKKEIGEEGYGIILSYHGNEDKDMNILMRNIVNSREITFATEEELASFLEGLLKNEDIKILNREVTKDYLSDFDGHKR